MTPSGKTTLGSVITITKGKKHSVVDSVSPTSKRLIGIDDLRNDDLIRFTEDNSGTDAATDDVLIAWDGANAGTIGFGKTGFIGSTIARLRPKEKDRFYTPFLGVFLQSKFSYLRQTATGATIPHINRKVLEGINLPDIGLDDQKRIAHLLGKVEGLIAQRKQHLHQLDDLLKSVFLEMFVEFLNAVGVSVLGDCLKIQQGFAFKSEEFIESGIPVIKIGTVNKGFFDYSTLSFISDSYTAKVRKYEIKIGDLLISLTGTVGKDDYGNTCFVPKDSIYLIYLLNQRVGKLICDADIANPYFIDAFLKLPKVKSTLIKQNRGVRQANLSNSDIYNIRLSIPPIDLQNQFAAIVEKVECLKFRYQQSLADLETLYGALSQKAFKGELDLALVPLPLEIAQHTEVVDLAPSEQLEPQIFFTLPAPTKPALLQSVKGRKTLLDQWLTVWLEHLGEKPFSAQPFLDAANQRLAELVEDDTPEWGVSEYGHLRSWVFEALAQGSLTQAYDDAHNRVQLKKIKP